VRKEVRLRNQEESEREAQRGLQGSGGPTEGVGLPAGPSQGRDSPGSKE
jgi:hypothetical protein